MEEIVPEPQSAADYDDRTTAAVQAVLVEIGQILCSFPKKFAVVGGAVPWLILRDAEMAHVGIIDVDIGLDADALGVEPNENLIYQLMEHDYKLSSHSGRSQLARQLPAVDGGGPIEIIVEFLVPQHSEIVRNGVPLISDFIIQKGDGIELALRFNETVEINGQMPDGRTRTVQVKVCSIPALLAMKGHAIHKRDKNKDAYDIYYCIRNYPNSPEDLAVACRPVLKNPTWEQCFRYIASKFNKIDGYGPRSVRQFVEGTDILDGCTADQWQKDAFDQVDRWLRALGLQEEEPPT